MSENLVKETILEIPHSRAQHPSSRLDVGSGEVLSLEQQRLVHQVGERIGEAIAEVQRCRMIPLAEAPPGAPGRFQMFQTNGHQFDFGVPQEQI